MRKNEKASNGPVKNTKGGMIPLEIKVPSRHLRTFEFYGVHYQIPLNALLQSEVYGQATSIADHAFWYLEYIEEVHSDEDLKEITLEFCKDVHDLLMRISSLLRRSMCELAQDLLSVGACTLADMITDAMEKDKMASHQMYWWADEAIKFARLSRLNQGMRMGNLDHWEHLSLSKLKASKKRGETTKMEVLSR